MLRGGATPAPLHIHHFPSLRSFSPFPTTLQHSGVVSDLISKVFPTCVNYTVAPGSVSSQSGFTTDRANFLISARRFVKSTEITELSFRFLVRGFSRRIRIFLEAKIQSCTSAWEVAVLQRFSYFERYIFFLLTTKGGGGRGVDFSILYEIVISEDFSLMAY